METTPTPEYSAHWETLNNLEQAFSKFYNVREILQSAIDSHSPDEMENNLTTALSYFDWATTQYDSSHKKVWDTLKNFDTIRSEPDNDENEDELERNHDIAERDIIKLIDDIAERSIKKSADTLEKDILVVLDRPEGYISIDHIVQSLKFLYPETYERVKSLDKIVKNCLYEMVIEKKISYQWCGEDLYSNLKKIF